MPRFVTEPYIKIGGQNVPQDFMDALLEIVVDTSLSMPSMFTIRVADSALRWVDNALLDIGKEVQISVKVPEEFGGGGLGVSLITGEITALEPHFSAGGDATMLVRGYDKSHRLLRDRKTRTFLKMQDSQIAQKIAGEAGLTPEVDATTVTHDYVLQYNQTNMEFLQARAERLGYQVYVTDGKLCFKKGDASPVGGQPELVYMENLVSFQPCWTVSHQANQMIVKGWDPKGKTAITSQKTPNASLNQGGMTQTGGAKVNSAFGQAQEIVADRPVFTAQEAEALATGLSNDISREYVQAEGVCDGDPNVKAGCKAKITGVGTRFSGQYLVTSATHIWNADGYITNFTISGRHPNTLSYLLDSMNGHGQGRGLVQGVVTGMVTNLNDPDNLGRVKVKYAWLGTNPQGGEIESDWVRIAAPMAGAQRGFFYLPEVNDEVLIAFEHGDVHRPYIIGVLWSSTDKPPKQNSEAVVGGKVVQRVLKSRQGHLIILSDKEGEEQISVTSKSGHTVILDDKSGSESITIKDKTGNNKMVFNSTNNSLTINVNGDFTVDAKGKITLQSAQDMTLDSKAQAKFNSMGPMNIESKAPTALKGVKVDINGNTMVSINGGPMTQIQGGIVKIN
jgi:phage protein D/phage baseplate assembly protein gpV